MAGVFTLCLALALVWGLAGAVAMIATRSSQLKGRLPKTRLGFAVSANAQLLRLVSLLAVMALLATALIQSAVPALEWAIRLVGHVPLSYRAALLVVALYALPGIAALIGEVAVHQTRAQADEFSKAIRRLRQRSETADDAALISYRYDAAPPERVKSISEEHPARNSTQPHDGA